MTTNHDFWVDRLSAWLDDDLPPREAEAVRDHLDGCPSCAAIATDLREVRERARALGDHEPDVDLWEGISARLGEDPLADEVIDLTARLGSAARRPPAAEAAPARRGIWMTPPKLAAAAVVLLAGGWALGSTRTPPSPFEDATTVAQSAAPARSVVSEASDLLGEATLGARLAELESSVRRNFEGLSPETRQVLERNLAVIDRALAESLAAIRAEPENEYLRDHLSTSLRRREAALSAAASLLDRSS